MQEGKGCVCLYTVRSFTPATRRSGHAGQVEEWGKGGGGESSTGARGGPCQVECCVDGRWWPSGAALGPRCLHAVAVCWIHKVGRGHSVPRSLGDDASTLHATRSGCAASSWGRAGGGGPLPVLFCPPPHSHSSPTHALLTGATCIVLVVLVVAFKTLSDVVFSMKGCAFHSRFLFADDREV